MASGRGGGHALGDAGAGSAGGGIGGALPAGGEQRQQGSLGMAARRLESWRHLTEPTGSCCLPSSGPSGSCTMMKLPDISLEQQELASSWSTGMGQEGEDWKWAGETSGDMQASLMPTRQTASLGTTKLHRGGSVGQGAGGQVEQLEMPLREEGATGQMCPGGTPGCLGEEMSLLGAQTAPALGERGPSDLSVCQPTDRQPTTHPIHPHT